MATLSTVSMALFSSGCCHRTSYTGPVFCDEKTGKSNIKVWAIDMYGCRQPRLLMSSCGQEQGEGSKCTLDSLVLSPTSKDIGGQVALTIVSCTQPGECPGCLMHDLFSSDSCRFYTCCFLSKATRFSRSPASNQGISSACRIMRSTHC
jgi:hypothetical protein